MMRAQWIFPNWISADVFQSTISAMQQLWTILRLMVCLQAKLVKIKISFRQVYFYRTGQIAQTGFLQMLF